MGLNLILIDSREYVTSLKVQVPSKQPDKHKEAQYALL